MKRQSAGKLEESSFSLTRQYIMPTHLDLVKAKQRRLSIVSRSPLAVFVQKMIAAKREELISSLSVTKETIEELCKEFSMYDFILNLQYAKGTTFNQAELDYIEMVQQIAALKYMVMVERDPHQTVEEFNKQLDGLVERNPRKIIVPNLEPFSYRLIEKIQSMRERGIEISAVIFRGAKGDSLADLSKALSNLRGQEIFSLVVGINPRKQRSNSASMFLPALQFQANAVSLWIPWRGGLSQVEFLCSDWILRVHAEADSGLANYDGLNRAELLAESPGVDFNTTLGRVDLVNQADLLARTFTPLTKAGFESLFN